MLTFLRFGCAAYNSHNALCFSAVHQASLSVSLTTTSRSTTAGRVSPPAGDKPKHWVFLQTMGLMNEIHLISDSSISYIIYSLEITFIFILFFWATNMYLFFNPTIFRYDALEFPFSYVPPLTPPLRQCEPPLAAPGHGEPGEPHRLPEHLGGGPHQRHPSLHPPRCSHPLHGKVVLSTAW